MLSRNCCSEVVLTASLYRNRVCMSDRGPNEHPSMLAANTINFASVPHRQMPNADATFLDPAMEQCIDCNESAG